MNFKYNIRCWFQTLDTGNSLAVQWLGLWAFTVKGPGESCGFPECSALPLVGFSSWAVVTQKTRLEPASSCPALRVSQVWTPLRVGAALPRPVGGRGQLDAPLP